MWCFGYGSSAAGCKKVGSATQSKQKQSNVSSSDFGSDSDSDYGEKESGVGLRRLFKHTDLESKLVGVVVTISSGHSYDPMFQDTEPSTVPGERISTYSLDCHAVGLFLQYLSGQLPIPSEQVWRDLLDDISKVKEDSVTFNWECCSECGDHGFPNSDQGAVRLAVTRVSRMFGGATATMQLMGLAMQRGYTVMCSDFSLKALIAEWSERDLGPNPFLSMGSFGGSFQLEFVPSELQHEEVPQQLQVVGELCAENGEALVSAMPDTIVYTVNPRRAPTTIYSLKVLTVATGPSLTENRPEAMMCSVGDGESLKRGMAGHVTLTYASGGQFVTSMGHWVELARIKTSAEDVLRVCGHNFGDEELTEIRNDLELQQSSSDREACVQKWAKSHISKSVPSRMKCRTKF